MAVIKRAVRIPGATAAPSSDEDADMEPIDEDADDLPAEVENDTDQEDARPLPDEAFTDLPGPASDVQFTRTQVLQWFCDMAARAKGAPPTVSQVAEDKAAGRKRKGDGLESDASKKLKGAGFTSSSDGSASSSSADPFAPPTPERASGSITGYGFKITWSPPAPPPLASFGSTAPVASPDGTFYKIECVNRRPTDAIDLQNLVWDRMDEQLALYYYRIANEDGTAITAAAGPAKGSKILHKLKRVDLLTTNVLTRKSKDVGEPTDLDLKAPDGNTRRAGCVDYGPGWLWVPNDVPFLVWEIAMSATLHKDLGNKPSEDVPIGRAAIYRIVWEAGKMVVKSGTPQAPGDGRLGSGGDARADRATEADYFWSGSDVILAAAIGFDPNNRIAPGFAPPASLYEEVSLRGTDFRYFKRWLPGRKKNLPNNSLPQPAITAGGATPFGPSAEPGNPAKKAFATYANVQLLRKKRKGEWRVDSGAKRDGMNLVARSQSKRKDAGTQMKSAYAQQGVTIDGSATLLVKSLLAARSAGDAAAKTAWSTFSTGLRSRTGETTGAFIKARKLALRTEQEWCHLHGHGDGGNETMENFVAGSEHCNTEQLAIETAQRHWPGKLRSKVTAYLMPNAGIVRRKLRPTDKDLLETLGWDGGDDVKVLEASLVGKTDSTAAFETWLPDKGKNQLPADAAGKNRKLKNLLRQVKDMVHLPHPVALAIRYKIYTLDDAGKPRAKVFDHVIEAQRESFDIFQFRALHWVARLAIASGMPASALTGLGGDGELPPLDDLSKVHVRMIGDAVSRCQTNEDWPDKYNASPPGMARLKAVIAGASASTSSSSSASPHAPPTPHSNPDAMVE